MPLRPPSSLPLRAALKHSSKPSNSTASSSAHAAALRQQSSHQSIRQQRAALSSTPRLASGHGSEVDPPSGWLWGEPPGTKKPREGWEISMYIFLAANALLTVGYIFKPDTSIQTWALEEARRRLEAEGILEDPDNKKE